MSGEREQVYYEECWEVLSLGELSNIRLNGFAFVDEINSAKRPNFGGSRITIYHR